MTASVDFARGVRMAAEKLKATLVNDAETALRPNDLDAARELDDRVRALRPLLWVHDTSEERLDQVLAHLQRSSPGTAERYIEAGHNEHEYGSLMAVLGAFRMVEGIEAERRRENAQ